MTTAAGERASVTAPAALAVLMPLTVADWPFLTTRRS